MHLIFAGYNRRENNAENMLVNLTLSMERFDKHPNKTTFVIEKQPTFTLSVSVHVRGHPADNIQVPEKVLLRNQCHITSK